MSNLVFPLAAIGAKVKSREPWTDPRIDVATNGKEAVSSWLMQPRCRYKVGFDVLHTDTLQDFQILAGFYSRHRGQFDTFLLLDETDYQVTAHGFGLGDGSTTTFQLQRSLLGRVYDTTGLWPTSSVPRRNLCTYSQDLTAGEWQKLAATAALSTSVLAPDGTATASKLTEDGTNASHYVAHITTTIPVVSGTTYVLSAWAKQGGGARNLYIQGSDGSTRSAIFDLAAGTVLTTSTGTTAYITAHPTLAGWWCCEVVFTAASSTNTSFYLMLVSGTTLGYTGDSASALYLWGAQAEAAARRTQYIPTTSAATTSNPAYFPAYADGFEPVWDVAPGPTLYKNGAALTLGSDYSISSTGLVTLTGTPASADVLTWTGSYYKRVRFEQPNLSLERLGKYMWASELGLVSVVP